MQKPRSVIVDEYDIVYTYEQAAENLGMSVGAVRNKACRLRKESGSHIVQLEALRTPKPDLRSILVVDDRLSPNPVPFLLPLVRLSELCGMDRATVARRYHEFGRIWENRPLPLKAFLKFTMTYRPKRGRHFKGSLLARNRDDR